MDIRLFVVQGYGEEKWIEGGWDDNTIDENQKGYDEALAEVIENHGAANVRVLVVKIPGDSFDRAFANVEVEGTVVVDE